MKATSIAFLIILHVVGSTLQAQRVKITPAQPKRGDTLHIVYDPSASGSVIPSSAKEVMLVFTYSNLYSQPWKMPMKKEGKLWVARFELPRYATYATFYLKSGEKIDKPADNRHYEIKVFDNGALVKDSYLYKAYSLSAQMGKTDDLPNKQLALFQEELKHFPDNYEARVRILDMQMKLAKAEQKDSLKIKALKVIADKFYADPTNGDNLNKVTMGYLIIGENSRLDSIRRVIAQEYAATDLGREYRVYFITKEKDTLDQIRIFEEELRLENDTNKKSFESIHSQLFNYYAAQQNADKALYQAISVAEADSSPHRFRTVRDIAQTLTDNNIGLNEAMRYAKEAYVIADTFSVGVIRYFPETGYIYPHVTDSARSAEHQQARANMLSLMGIIAMKQGNDSVAKNFMQQASALSLDGYTVNNVRVFLKKLGDEQSLAQLALREQQALRKKLEAVQTHKKAPVLNMFVDLQGKPIDEKSMKGKIVVINFWATWCVPCMAEMPHLQKVYDKYRNNKKLMFMIVNSGSGNKLKDAQDWSGNKQYSFPVYFNTDANISKKLDFNTIPATYIIDASGNIRFTNIGFDGSDLLQKLSMQIEMAGG